MSLAETTLWQTSRRSSGKWCTVTEQIDFRKGPPFTELDYEICRIVGKYMGDASAEDILLWQPQPSIWSRMGPFDRPKEPREVSLEAHTMMNEYEAVAFNLSNNTSQTIHLRLEVAGSVGETDVFPASLLTLREVIFVEASGYRLYADALPEVRDGKLEIAPGMTKQVWITIHSAGVKPGTYKTQITVAPEKGDPINVPLAITVYPLTMPKNPKYLTQAFAYFTWPPVVGREEATARDLSAHYSNSHVLHHAYIPWPKTDEKQLPTEPLDLDFTKLDEMLSYRPDVRLWIL